MKAGIYLRVSSQRQAEKWSLGAQRKILLEHARRQGWEPEIYDEGAVSGETIADRPVMRRLLADIAAGAVDVVLVVEWERLCRASDLVDLAAITGAVRRAGALIATPERVYDLARAEDDFESDLRGILSKREKRKLLERCARGRAAARDAGRWLGWQAPWGYRYDPGLGTLVPVPELVPWVRRIFTEDLGVESLVREFRAAGIKIDRGTMYRMRRNPAYQGMAKDSRGRLCPGTWEGIVTPEEWAAAQRGIERRRTRPWHPVKNLLVGLARCSACGGRIIASRIGGSRRWPKKGARQSDYACKTWRRKTGVCPSPGGTRTYVLDALVLDAWERLVADPQALSRGYEALVERLQLKAAEAPLQDLDRALRALEARQERLLDAVEAGELPIGTIGARLKAIDAQRASLEAERRKAVRAVTSAELPPFQDVLAQARAFEGASFETRREILRAFLEGIAVDFGERRLTVSWLFGPPMTYRLPNLRSWVAKHGGREKGERALRAGACEFRETQAD